jgi:hypothetical protein
MFRIAQHRILVAGNSFDSCSEQVHRFFNLTSLVIYDCIEVRPEQSFSGLDAGFAEALSKAVAENEKIVGALISDLQKTGLHSISDLHHLKQGYPSKVLHIIAHFLDGFVGIDSYFYNLPDDSHWISEETAAAVSLRPEKYWLIHIDCYSAAPEEAALLHLQGRRSV